MSHTQGKTSVSSALAGNTLVTILKTAVSVLTGSASMFAESIHSLADTLNQSLLLIGLVRSKKPADTERGYGYGIERFFWSLISACGILFVGAGVSMYHSIESLLHGGTEAYIVSPISIAVLLIAFVIESGTLFLALKELKGTHAWSADVFEHADPVTLSVVYEDGAAVLGVVVALSAQWVSHITNDARFDAIGGIIVGCILGFLAVLLIRKNYHYIIGKPLRDDVKEEIIEFLLQDPCIEKIVDFKSVAVDVSCYRIYVTAEWNGSPLYREIYEEGDLLEEWEEIKADFNEFTRLMYKTVDRVPRLVGTHIDKVERAVIQQFPEIAYMDIELN